MEESNVQLELAREFVESTNANVFLTGKAGTGKTTFLRSIHLHSSKQVVVTAPTGVAALNAGGVTLHSLFQLPFSPFVPSKFSQNNISSIQIKKFSKHKLALIRSIELLIIDEISMVR
ncbi:MAG: AAA family ATPase, partial [Rikenellaceae bacterium]